MKYKVKFAFLPTKMNHQEDSPVVFFQFYKELKTSDRRRRRYNGRSIFSDYKCGQYVLVSPLPTGVTPTMQLPVGTKTIDLE